MAMCFDWWIVIHIVSVFSCCHNNMIDRAKKCKSCVFNSRVGILLEGGIMYSQDFYSLLGLVCVTDWKHMSHACLTVFIIGEIKTLMIQLLRAVAHLHDNWILHRDLKASNLLLSNKGILKVGSNHKAVVNISLLRIV